MNYAKIMILGILSLMFLGLSTGYVGTAPGIQDLGVLEKGNSYEAHFYILTDQSEPFLVQPKYDPAHTSILKEGQKRTYDFNPEEASEEDISSWIDFSRESYRVNPDEVSVIQLDGGGVARSSQRVSYTLKVPENAEPGYRMGAVNLNPDFEPDTEGPTSLQTVGLTQFNFVFRVPGKAERDLNILDVNSKRVSEDEARIDFLMENNGTVTTQVQSAETTIYNMIGNKSGEVIVTGDKLSPDETRVVKTYWNKKDIESGEYRVEGEMSYVTGTSYVDSSIQIPDEIQIKNNEEPEEEENIPMWLVGMVLLLIGVVMYYFEISPVWIAGFIGLGILTILFISMDVSLVILGTFLIIPALIGIYRWL